MRWYTIKLYVLQQKELGYEILYNNSSSISCKEFKDLCSKLEKEYGNDIYILKDELYKYGFKSASVECKFTIQSDIFEID